MKLNATTALVLLLVAPLACKSKDKATDATAAGASALASGAVLPSGPAGGSLALLDGFEGEIAVAARGKLGGSEGSATPANFTLLVKDGKFRVALPESLTVGRGFGSAYLLVQPLDKKMYAVLDGKKQAILIDLDKVASQAKALGEVQGAPKTGTTPAADVQKTGKTDTVAGYKCEIWHVVQAKSVGDLCIAEQGTSWFHIPLSGAPAELAWAAEITDGKHFPLRFVSNENGAEQGRIEVTSIEKKALPASEFEVPAGYNVLSLEQMLGAFMGGLSAGGGTPGLPPGVTLPPGVKLPPGVTLPPGVKLPPGVTLPSRAK